MQPNPQLRRVLATLDGLPALTPADARRVGQLIVGNPYLLEQFNRAAASGALKGFAEEKDGWNAASFGGGMIRLVPSDLRPGYFDPMALTFLLGHEIQHANDPALRTAFDTFIGAANAIARSGTGVHDYTAPLVRYLDTKRDGEGLASIAGFNAVHAALVAKGIPPTVENMLRACPVDMASFLDDARGPKRWDPSLRLAHDGSLQAVPGNVTVLNWRYFHANDGGKDYDYLHKYASHALGYALYNDRNVAMGAGRPPPRIVVDFRFLGLTAAELQLAGLAMDPPQRIYERPTDPSPSHVIGRRPESLLDEPVPSASGDAVAAPSASVASVGRPVSLAGADGLTADAARALDAARASASIREADGHSGAIGDALDVQAR
ncbi:MAG TPA: hypothetical protein VFE72_07640, partial [Lysobacter sp.]|nr:hypothetical protein [Lysobacter sp.]